MVTAAPGRLEAAQFGGDAVAALAGAQVEVHQHHLGQVAGRLRGERGEGLERLAAGVEVAEVDATQARHGLGGDGVRFRTVVDQPEAECAARHGGA